MIATCKSFYMHLVYPLKASQWKMVIPTRSPSIAMLEATRYDPWGRSEAPPDSSFYVGNGPAETCDLAAEIWWLEK